MQALPCWWPDWLPVGFSLAECSFFCPVFSDRMQQFALDIGFESSPDFDNFAVGENQAAWQHVQLWASSPARSPVPAYLWGETGAGKTHLLQAAAAVMQAGGEQVFCLQARDSAPEVPYQEDWSVAVLDDVHLYNAQQQRVAFGVFVDAQKHGRWVLLAGSLPPVDLLHIREDLRTRLGWGHVFELKGLSEQECRAVLRQEANARGIVLSDEVMQYILVRFHRDMGNLMRLLNEMDRYAMRLKKGAITVAMVRKTLETRLNLGDGYSGDGEEAAAG